MTTTPQPFDRLTRQTAAFLAAAGIPHDRLAAHNSPEWKLFIAGYECAERALATVRLAGAPVAEAAPTPALPTIRIQFKDPDAIYYVINARHPLPDDEDDITPRMEKEREEFSDQYFEYGDYGMIEIEPTTMAVRLLPRSEWK